VITQSREPVEDPLAVGNRHAGPAVDDGRHDAMTVVGDTDADGRAGR
jgi:hypothetical protein